MIRTSTELKRMKGVRAERIEYISAHECQNCGHIITDHKRAGEGELGRKSHVEGWKESAKRDYCIGNHGTCNCRLFRQPHEKKISVVVSR
jgi:ribosomal protein L32